MKIGRKRHFEAEVFSASMNDIMFFLMLFFLIISTLANPNVIRI
ncbi:MAG: biopolymer transporter ExbD, partial [Chitinophagales bacterium]